MAVTLGTTPAYALDTAGSFSASIGTGSTGAAVGTVADTLLTTTAYTGVLTAAGEVTCATGEASIQAAVTGTGNPLTLRTPGACTIVDGAVEYTLTWTSVLGTSGQLYVTCIWVGGAKTCTPGVLHGELVPII
jgi:hypothetical protein